MVAGVAAVLALTAFAPRALAQDPVPTEPVVTEPAPPAPAPDPAPDPPRAAVTPKPKPKPVTKPVQRPAAPTVTPSNSPARVVVPTPSRPSVQRPAQRAPRTKSTRVAPPKRKATKKKRVDATVPAAGAGAVAGATAALPEVTTTVPSDLAAGAVQAPSAGDAASSSVLMMSLIALALALAALASVPTRQLAVLPATRWIAKRRLDVVIAGMGALAALLGVLLISAVFGP